MKKAVRGVVVSTLLQGADPAQERLVGGPSSTTPFGKGEGSVRISQKKCHFRVQHFLDELIVLFEAEFARVYGAKKGATAVGKKLVCPQDLLRHTRLRLEDWSYLLYRCRRHIL